jgi:hypothetical protein
MIEETIRITNVLVVRTLALSKTRKPSKEKASDLEQYMFGDYELGLYRRW